MDEMEAAHSRDYHAMRRMDDLRAQITAFLEDPPYVLGSTFAPLELAAKALERESAFIVRTWD